MTEAPDTDPEALTGLLPSDRIEAARTAAERFGGRDEERIERARAAFGTD